MNPSSDRAPQLLNRRQVRAVDRIAIERHGMHSLVLMENAGRGCADLLESLGINGRIDICCGKGNNGGDGFVVARHLLLRGHLVQVHYFDDPSDFSSDAAANFEILRRGAASLRRVTSDELTSHRLVQELATAEWIVDALLGTGAGGAPRFPYDEVIRQANSCSARRLAIDWPSGLDCDTGVAADPTFLADHTGTFVATKLGTRNPDAAAFVGTLQVLDIGVLPRVVEEAISEGG